jgi:hypothetical protein
VGLRIYSRSVYPQIEDYRILDSGGLLVVLLSTITIGLMLFPLPFVKRPGRYAVVSSVALVAVSLYHIGSIKLEGRFVSPPSSLGVGLAIVFVGSLMQLSGAVFNHRQRAVEPFAGANNLMLDEGDQV